MFILTSLKSINGQKAIASLNRRSCTAVFEKGLAGVLPTGLLVTFCFMIYTDFRKLALRHPLSTSSVFVHSS